MIDRALSYDSSRNDGVTIYHAGVIDLACQCRDIDDPTASTALACLHKRPRAPVTSHFRRETDEGLIPRIKNSVVLTGESREIFCLSQTWSECVRSINGLPSAVPSRSNVQPLQSQRAPSLANAKEANWWQTLVLSIGVDYAFRESWRKMIESPS